jgi:hypothetical protein
MNKNIIIELHPDKWDDTQLHTALGISNERFDQIQDIALTLLSRTKTKSEAFAVGSKQVENVNELAMFIASLYMIERRAMEFEQTLLEALHHKMHG